MGHRHLSLLTVTGLFWFFAVSSFILGTNLDGQDLLWGSPNEIALRLAIRVAPGVFSVVALALSVALARTAPSSMVTIGLGLLAWLLIGSSFGYPVDLPLYEIPAGNLLVSALGIVLAALFFRRVVRATSGLASDDRTL